jgi:hypothetical protein
MAESTLFEGELHAAMQQHFDEMIEAMQLAKASPDLDDLAAVFAAAHLKLGQAVGLVEHHHPGFAKDVEEKLKRIVEALAREQRQQQQQRPPQQPH